MISLKKNNELFSALFGLVIFFLFCSFFTHKNSSNSQRAAPRQKITRHIAHKFCWCFDSYYYYTTTPNTKTRRIIIMFGMGQYEKVGDSAKVRIRRGVCFVSILFFLYILSSSSFFVVLRCFVVRNRGIQFSLSLSFFHSFLFVSFVRDSRVVLLYCVV